MDETKVLAKELRKHERGRGKRYPKELEARARACIVTRRARGHSLEGIATDLGTLEVLRSTSIGEAARYAYGNRGMLERFLDDARIPLDNNRTDRALRGPIVGCRNHFGSKSERGIQVAAIFYSLLETANLVGVNPAEYLREAVLAARAGRVLLPSDFAGG